MQALWASSTVLVLVAAVFSQPGRAEPAEAEWRSIPLVADGELDPAWRHTGYGKFSVHGESVRTDCDERGLGLLVYTKERLGDCQIRLSYRCETPTSNAGVYVRIDDEMLERLDDKPAPVRRDASGDATVESIEQVKASAEKGAGPWYAVHHGYEVQICDAADPWHRTGSIYSLAEAAEAPKGRAGQWRTMVITLAGDTIRVEIDGAPVSSFDSSKPARPREAWHEPRREPKRPRAGYIGLQNHDPGDVVYFRDVAVRPLAE